MRKKKVEKAQSPWEQGEGNASPSPSLCWHASLLSPSGRVKMRGAWERHSDMPLGDTQPPRGLVRVLLRGPIWFYRFHLGWVLGNRFLLLTHTGRQTGRPRHTVLEVVDYDATTGTYIVASGWGEKADWLRNIERMAQVRVTVGKRHCEAIASRLSKAEACRTLRRYTQRHPLAFRVLTTLMGGQWLRGTEEDCAQLAQSVPLIAVHCKTTAGEAGR